jgi:CheY-like chemotaxis protein
MSASTPTPSARAVLVVEDDLDVRALTAEVLRADGHEVHEAAHGQEAIDVIDALPAAPSVVLLDLMMPVMDGAAFIRYLRARSLDIPIIVMTASGVREIAGVREVLCKPVDFTRVRSLVGAYCSDA